MNKQLYKQLDFIENHIYEPVISDLLDHKYAIINAFFDSKEVDELPRSLKDIVAEFLYKFRIFQQ